MELEFFTPVNAELAEIAGNKLRSSLRIHLEDKAFPDLDGVKIAFFGVLEDRLDEEPTGEPFNFDDIRREFYNLYPGNWHLPMADLGDIQKGETVEDTFFAVQSAVNVCLKKGIIPVILGGSEDLVYAQYRAYDGVEQMVNLVNIDSKFDLGDADKPISNRSYVGKIVVTKPYNLFNYSSLGYQTYFNSQDEIELMDRLFFDAYRLGEVTGDITVIEPVMRDANLVSLDLGAISGGALGNYRLKSPNGFDGKEICALSRYAGISDKVSSFGVYEYTARLNFPASRMLIAQILWYFVEGVNFRKNENTISSKKEFIRYQVPIDDEILVFYKSPVSGRWWIEIPFISPVSNKLKRHTLLPCTQGDYLDACNQIIPERWYKTKRKNEI
ncbi:formimidoylglutamase [Salinimicrobium sediminilitoris]|uniref:formimidoylglutamase n=1 Tax=Salinimicrobium sediminilitoris TaxID=2876715 RepID=UPI001E46637B|nr:formimidoylglutamase [Salinimicrobium sediminilitoris]MCC8359956.1 formimidoylglutamase [Salinimicrobium sediminilitoris]